MDQNLVNLELDRLRALYKDIPENKKELCEGLLVEAARLKISLDELWEDLLQNGNTELNERGKEVERVNSAIFTTRDKSYRATLKHLDSLLPAGTKKSGFSKLDDDEDDELDS